MGLYHCASEEPCSLATETWVTAKDIFPEEIRRAIEDVSAP